MYQELVLYEYLGLYEWLLSLMVSSTYNYLIPTVIIFNGLIVDSLSWMHFAFLKIKMLFFIFLGLKTMVNAMFKSLRMLTDVFYLTIFFLCIFALLGLQMFMGVLSQKCCLPYDYNRSTTDPDYPATLQKYVLNESKSTIMKDDNENWTIQFIIQAWIYQRLVVLYDMLLRISYDPYKYILPDKANYPNWP